MRTILVLFSFGLMVASSAQAGAATTGKKVSRKAKLAATKAHKKGVTKKPAANEGHLSTDVSFDDSVLRGEYQAPEEALAKVENEKGFGDLIGVRKHFKDRLSVAAEQE